MIRDVSTAGVIVRDAFATSVAMRLLKEHIAANPGSAQELCDEVTADVKAAVAEITKALNAKLAAGSKTDQIAVGKILGALPGALSDVVNDIAALKPKA